MTRAIPILLACAALACGHSGPPPGPVPPVPPELRGPPSPGVQGLHAACPPAGCAAGQKCLEYCGVGGCTPQTTFRTCEIPCATDVGCPPFLACRTVADGPGRVCTETR